MNEIKLDYNSTYISSNLIDELDYFIGEYSKPDATFLYSLNAFLEAYILNTTFYLSETEYKHISLISKSLFPNGRPILELLIKNKQVKVIGGIGTSIATVTGIFKTDLSNPQTYQEKINEFLDNGLKTEIAQSKYMTISNIHTAPAKINFLSIGKIDDGFIAVDINETPHNFYKSLAAVTHYSNVQSALPFYSYKLQMNELRSRGTSTDIICQLTKLFETKQKDLNEYFGISKQQIPPLVNILLSQCQNLCELPSKIEQLSHDFTELRSSIIKYEKRLNESKNIKEQIDSIDEYNEFWKTFNRKYGDNSRLHFNFWESADDLEYDKAIDNAIDNNTYSSLLEDLNVGKIIGKGAKKLIDIYKERRIVNRFRGVTDLWNLFNKSPNVTEHIKNFERVFNVKLDRNSLEILKKQLYER